jgi:hypothetical protein
MGESCYLHILIIHMFGHFDISESNVINLLSGNSPHFIILLCLTPDEKFLIGSVPLNVWL